MSSVDSSTSPSADGPYTIILFYLYTHVASPAETIAWQQALCERLQLKGRIRIALEGINGTLAGSDVGIQSYINDMNDTSQPHRGLFAGIEYKYSYDTKQPFPALGMFNVKELTATGAMAKSCKLIVEENGQTKLIPAGRLRTKKESSNEKKDEDTKETSTDATTSSASPDAAAESSAAAASSSSPVPLAVAGVETHLTPEEWHSALDTFNPETDLLLDVRNAYETAIGTFDGAVDPKLRAFAQLPEYVTQNLKAIKAKKSQHSTSNNHTHAPHTYLRVNLLLTYMFFSPLLPVCFLSPPDIYMYCTGGIRCEKACLYMTHRSGANVRQLKGGIHKYLDAYPDGGHFKGKNFVFDGRLAMGSNDKTIVGKCVHCATTCDDLSEQVLCRVCKMFVILCATCRKTYEEKGWQIYCSEHILLAAGKDYVPTVPTPAAAAAAAAVAPAESSSSPPPVTVDAPAAATADAAVDDDDEGPSRPEDDWTPPSSDAGCIEQMDSFLSRFTLEQVEHQLNEIERILNFFRTSQKKSGSRSKNRKHNLFTQKIRLETYLTKRRTMEAEERGEVYIPPVKEMKKGRTTQTTMVDDNKQTPTLTTFVPFLNV